MKTINPDGSQTIQYGIQGASTIYRNADGFISVPVIVEASNAFHAPPAEMRIVEILPADDLGYCRQRVALENRDAEQRFYLGTALIKIEGDLETVTDEMIITEGLTPLQ